MPLAAALQPLASLNQFVICRVDPDPQPGAPWKTAKIPLNPTTMWAGNAQDPANWLDAASAFTLSERAGPRFIVGFVITAADPFWCVDIDNCLLPDNTWSPVAQQLCAYFPGGAVELSDSGHGLHIWGCGTAPAHAKKNTAHHVEFYTELRFIALGRQAQATGTVALDWTAKLPGLVDAYFPPGSDELAGAEGDFDHGPVPEWRGPADDADLLRRALRSQSASAIGFGGTPTRASFADLWECNLEALGRAYPSSTGDAFDRSSADQALANHLSFWTGRDAQRMNRLMRESKLARPKWDDRGDYYLGRTLERACVQGKDVLTDKAPAEAPLPAPESESAPKSRKIEGNTFLSGLDQAEYFDGCVYVTDLHAILTPRDGLLAPDRFKAVYGSRTFAMDAANEKTSRDAWEALSQSQVNAMTYAHATTFRPDLAFGATTTEGTRRVVNTYRPIETKRRTGDPRPFLDHMGRILPDARDRAILLAYMAAIVQYKGVKFSWAPVVQGTPGNGKTLLSRCVSHAVGDEYSFWPTAAKMTNQFNGWLENKIFLAVEDIHIGEDQADFLNRMKPLITNNVIEIERKGKDQQTKRVCANLILNMNNKAGIRKTADDRRYAIFYTRQQEKSDLARDGLDSAYFKRLYDWLEHGHGYEIVNEMLNEHIIPPEFNPAEGCNVAPDTTSTAEAMRHSLGTIEQEIDERIEQGAQGFAGGFVSSHYLDLMLREMHRANAIPHNRRRDLMRAVGYDWHPALPEGRTHNPVLPDAKRVRLYAKIGHTVTRLPAGAVARAYTEAQLEVAKL